MMTCGHCSNPEEPNPAAQDNWLDPLWFDDFEGVQWWMSAIGAVVFLLLAAFVIPLSTLTLHTKGGTMELRGTASPLHDITDALQAQAGYPLSLPAAAC